MIIFIIWIWVNECVTGGKGGLTEGVALEVCVKSGLANLLGESHC